MNYEEISAAVGGEVSAEHSLLLNFGGCSLRLMSNSETLLAELGNYFARHLGSGNAPTITLTLLEGPKRSSPIPVAQWRRPPGKKPKEYFADLDDGRLIQKANTQILFLQGHNRGVATGPLLAHVNQVVNFVNNQTISYWKRNGWEICHAAALSAGGKLFAFAGFSGGGKSTLMLHLMNAGAYDFVSNDRLLIKRTAQGVEARGVAKLPRVNPGTLLNNPALVNVLPEARKQALSKLSEDELWSLEEKYDAPMADVFGEERIAESGLLAGVVILNWSRQSDVETRLAPTSLSASSELLEALMKSAGPFFADSDGLFLENADSPAAAPYLAALNDTPIYQLSGRVDFPTAVDLCIGLMSE